MVFFSPLKGGVAAPQILASVVVDFGLSIRFFYGREETLASASSTVLKTARFSRLKMKFECVLCSDEIRCDEGLHLLHNFRETVVFTMTNSKHH